MSTAHLVPETYGLSGDDARKTLARTGRVALVRDAVQRLRVADGFSHARSLAFMTALGLVQALIAVVGLASAAGQGAVRREVVRTMQHAVPGPAGKLLTAAAVQAEHGVGHRFVPLAFGLVGSVVTATTAFGQIERACNRIYGIEQDRPTVAKYLRGLVLALTAGTLGVVSFGLIALGRSVVGRSHGLVPVMWGILRWPAGLALIATAITVLLRHCPRRRMPEPSWLAYGATVSVALWFVATALLALFFQVSTSFGETYGPLAGMVALLFWSLLSAIALLVGAAVAAQLEAVRAHAAEPQDERKVAASEPRSGGAVRLAPN